MWMSAVLNQKLYKYFHLKVQTEQHQINILCLKWKGFQGMNSWKPSCCWKVINILIADGCFFTMPHYQNANLTYCCDNHVKPLWHPRQNKKWSVFNWMHETLSPFRDATDKLSFWVHFVVNHNTIEPRSQNILCKKLSIIGFVILKNKAYYSVS